MVQCAALGAYPWLHLQPTGRMPRVQASCSGAHCVLSCSHCSPHLQVRRPSDFQEDAAAHFGPTQPATYINRVVVDSLCKTGMPPAPASAGAATGAAGGAAAATAAAFLPTRPEGPDPIYVSGAAAADYLPMASKQGP